MSETIEQIRALLAQFENSGWRDLHIRTGSWELFFAKPEGGVNPMRLANITTGEAVAAPHLGLFTASCAVGEMVAVGGPIGHLAVLDEIEEIASDRAGRIVAVAADNGVLVEFGAELVRVG